MTNLDDDLKMLQDFVAIPNNLEDCQRQLMESRDYIDNALRAVAYHKRHKLVPVEVSNKCHYLAKMLNDNLLETKVSIDYLTVTFNRNLANVIVNYDNGDTLTHSLNFNKFKDFIEAIEVREFFFNYGPLKSNQYIRPIDTLILSMGFTIKKDGQMVCHCPHYAHKRPS